MMFLNGDLIMMVILGKRNAASLYVLSWFDNSYSDIIQCAKIKNMCSTCLLDLEFQLPAHIRDAVLEPDEVMRVPTNQANRE